MDPRQGSECRCNPNPVSVTAVHTLAWNRLEQACPQDADSSCSSSGHPTSSTLALSRTDIDLLPLADLHRCGELLRFDRQNRAADSSQDCLGAVPDQDSDPALRERSHHKNISLLGKRDNHVDCSSLLKTDIVVHTAQITPRQKLIQPPLCTVLCLGQQIMALTARNVSQPPR